MTVVKCGKCDRATTGKDGRKVYVRVSGRATMYQSTPQVWCGRCRAVYFGSWKNAK